MADKYSSYMAQARAFANEGNMEAADRAARLAQKYKAPQTNLVEQGMSGVNQGIASMAGIPVDAATARRKPSWTNAAFRSLT